MKNKHQHRSKYIIKLSSQEKQQLQDITKKGVHQARVVCRARILLLLDSGTTSGAAQQSGASIRTVERIRQRHRNGGIDRALYDAPRPGGKRLFTDKTEARLIAIACSEPPTGHEHWTLEMLKRKLITDKVVETVSTVTIWHTLNNKGIKPWREKNVVHSEAE